jgi:hypothetical protein
MKQLLIGLLLALSALQTLHAADMAAMVKKHTTNNKFDGRPFGGSDFSYGAFFEFFEGPAGWRLGAMYASGTSGDIEADSVITPEITLLLQDGIWEAGVSILMDYIDDGNSTGWSDHYYQFQLGINLPFGKALSVGAHAFFPFDGFSNVGDFRFSNLDYGATIRFRF